MSLKSVPSNVTASYPRVCVAPYVGMNEVAKEPSSTCNPQNKQAVAAPAEWEVFGSEPIYALPTLLSDW